MMGDKKKLRAATYWKRYFNSCSACYYWSWVC